jgi:hypothetical protein
VLRDRTAPITAQVIILRDAATWVVTAKTLAPFPLV